ncbi:hypothetical protein ACQ4PT_013730 [Festuca glaucescens]
MGSRGAGGGADEEAPVPPKPSQQRYRPVEPHDGAVVQMESMESGASADTSTAPRRIKPSRNRSMDPKTQVTSSNGPSSGPHSDSKLELFGFDSLVNILGLKRIVGMGGVWQSLVLCAFCGACTFLTGLSLSAIATNGAMKGGGPYYLIGRALGPEVGVSIGLCFFLGNAVAGAMYVLGAVETFLDAVPSAGFFQGLFFPAVTGIMAGSNRSASLKDTQRSIPIGTLNATLSTTAIIVQTMGLGNLKPNIVVMRYPEIWRHENLTQIPSTFVSIINDCITANKAVVTVKGLDEWPNEYQRQYGTIDLYWIVRDGGLMLLLSQLLLTKDSFESCKIQVFCIAEEDTEAEELKADVKNFLYDLRMQAEVIVVTMRSFEAHADGSRKDDPQEAYTSAQQRIRVYLSEMKEAAQREGRPLMEGGKQVMVNEQKVDKFLNTMLKLNATILKHSRMAAVVLVSLPAPPLNQPAYCYMEYMDLLIENVPRMLIVRGYRRDVVTLFT